MLGSVRRRVSEGEVVVRVELTDIGDAGAVFHTIMRRCQYPYMLLAPTARFYSAMGVDEVSVFLASEETAPWFGSTTSAADEESEAVVLWHRPLGLISDMAGGGPVLRLKLHFATPSQPLPRELLPGAHTEEAARSTFFSALKEADKVRGSGGLVMSLAKREQSLLWDSLCSMTDAKAEDIERVRLKLLEGVPKGVPLRVYSSALGRMRTGPIKYDPDMSIAEAVRLVLGEPNGLQGIAIEGVKVDLQTPIQVVLETLCSADNMLHIVCD